MMSIAKKVLIGIAVVGLLFVGSALTYRMVKTQGVTESYIINQDKPQQPRILIATQKKEFKDNVMTDIADYYTDQSVFISVVDVTTLDTVNADDWDGIVLFTTIESDEPPKVVIDFLEGQKDLSNKFLMLTADSGKWVHPNTTDVDVVTSASLKKNVKSVSETMIDKIDGFVKNK